MQASTTIIGDNLSPTAPPKKKMSVAKIEKLALVDFDLQVKEIRAQFGDQLRCLETRTETQVALIQELYDFFRRRSDLENEHARLLEKLAKSIMQKHKNERQKRDAWLLHSSCALWQQLVDDTKVEAQQRALIADLYANHICVKLLHRIDDIQRISRKCRDIGAVAHGEVSRVLSELHTAMKTYQLCYAQSSSVEAKFRVAEQVKLKYEEANPNKLGVTRKHRTLERDYDKKQVKYQEFKLKALKARNEYLLCVHAANAALHKYYAEDLSDLIDCMDLGMQHWLCDLVTTAVSARKTLCQMEMDSLAELSGFKDSLDAKVDKQRFFEANHSVFMLPKRFEFRPHFGDHIKQLSAQKGVQDELLQRFRQIQKRLCDLKFESDEVWKTLETAELRVIQLQTEQNISVEDLMMSANDFSTNAERKSFKESDLQIQKRKQDLAEIEDFYLNKFSHYLLNANLIKRLQARYDCISVALGASNGNGNSEQCSSTIGNGSNNTNGFQLLSTDPPSKKQLGLVIASGNRRGSHDGCSSVEDPLMTPGGSSESSETIFNRPPSVPPKPRKKRIGASANNIRRPKLFGGSLEEYVEATGEEIPLVVISTIRMLTLFALHHQGVFRVSGSQIEINSFKESFERGEDPLVNCVDASDVNSVAGVLKLYLRELREPLFPIYMFDQLTECAKYPKRAEFLLQVVPLINSLPRATILVLRYLFAFLNHLSEYSDENMMDPYNLAICFGPTLLPIPEGKDQVFFHNFVNELVKNLIIFYEDVFNWDMPGPVYEKYLMLCDDNVYNGDGDHIASLGNDDDQQQQPQLISSTMLDSVIDSLPAVDEDDVVTTDGGTSIKDLPKMTTTTTHLPPISPSHNYYENYSSTPIVRSNNAPMDSKQPAPAVWTKRTYSEPYAHDDLRCYEKIWSIQERNKKSLPSRLRNNRLSLQTCSLSPPSSPIENGVRPSSTNTNHHQRISPIQAPQPINGDNDDDNGFIVSGGLSPTSLHEIQTELKAVLSSLEQFSIPDSPTSAVNTGKKFAPDLVCSLPSQQQHQRAGSEPRTIMHNRPSSHEAATNADTNFIRKM